MSEIVRDVKCTNIEITSDLGLTFYGNNPRLRHTGTGTFTIDSTQGKINISSGSNASDSLNLDSNGGIDIDGAGEISIETSDTSNGIKIAETSNIPVDIGAGGGNFLLGKLGETAQFRGSLTITGDLTVNGDAVTTNVIINESEDPVMRLNKNASGTNTVDIGFVGDRGDDTNIGWIWDESADEFATVFISDDTQLSLTGSTQNTVFTDYADFHAGTATFDDTLYAAGQRFSVTEVTGNTLVNQGTFTVTSTTNAVNAIRLNVDGGLNESITINSIQGTSVMTNNNSNAAVQLHATDGGIGLRSTADLAGSIQIEADGGELESIIIKSDQGTSVTSINLISDAGGVTITTNNSAAITVENDGTVGINTSNPDNTYALDVEGTINTTGLYQADSLLIPPGCIMSYSAASAPGGWLICNGAAVSRTTYAALFAIISVTYGAGDSATTFNLPNMVGRIIVGLKSGDSNYNSLGETGGSKNKTLNTTEIPSHTHTGTVDSNGSHTHTATTDSNGAHVHAVTDPGHTHDVSGTLSVTGSGTVGNPDSDGSNEPNVQTTVTTTSSSSTTGISIVSNGAHTHTLTTASSGSHAHTFTSNATGGGSAFSLLNPYIVFNYIIKY